MLVNRWQQCKASFHSITISHTYREANFSADTAAKEGAMLNENVIHEFVGKAPWLLKWESPSALYF
ncbi:hypothetical protein FRX31_024763, partial [Thalictrum thalictroides]